MATYPPNQTTPSKGSGNYLWNWLGTPLKKFAEALQSYISVSSDKLVAGSRELTLDNLGELAINSGNLTIVSPNLDVRLEAGDDVRLLAQDVISIEAQNDITLVSKTQVEIGYLTPDFDSGNGGQVIKLLGGEGASGDTVDAGPGGNIDIYAGNAGTSNLGQQSVGGDITIEGGHTTRLSPYQGGQVYIRGGSSADGIEGIVRICSNVEWTFNPNTGAVECPVVLLAALGLPTPKGKRAMISDSTVAASGNFGAIAVGGGNNTVPVFSDGTNWLIG